MRPSGPAYRFDLMRCGVPSKNVTVFLPGGAVLELHWNFHVRARIPGHAGPGIRSLLRNVAHFRNSARPSWFGRRVPILDDCTGTGTSVSPPKPRSGRTASTLRLWCAERVGPKAIGGSPSALPRTP